MIERYLDRWGDPQLASLPPSLGDRFEVDLIVVIPACCEMEALPSALDHLSSRWLGIVVVNGRKSAPSATHQENAAVLTTLHDQTRDRREHDGVFSGWWRGKTPLLVIDRASVGRRLGPKSGVGDARKLGCDLATQIAQTHGVPWVFSTDADAHLPANLAAELALIPETSGSASWPYLHVWMPDVPAEEREALTLYELSLRHYTSGLVRAASPYAFPTLGSALAFRPRAYAAVRGFPRRQAGEDFYLLNKLAKVGGVAVPDASPIQIVGRPSLRVPFGTGPAMSRIRAAGLSASFELYDPRVFDIMSAVQTEVRCAPQSLTPEALTTSVIERLSLHSSVAVEPRLRDAIRQTISGWSKGMTHVRRQGHTQAMRTRQLQTYIDAFRTLKLVHAVRAAGLPMLPWREALPFVSESTTPGDALAHLRRSTKLGYEAGLPKWRQSSFHSSRRAFSS